MNLFARFTSDRQQAFAASDPMAAVCTVANTDGRGHIQMRTLVLRDVADRLAIFINETSPKWAALQQQASLVTYWPSQQLQYRIQAETEEVDPDIVSESWQLRPPAPKQMDWFYSQHLPQSTAVTSREDLLTQVAAQKLPDPLIAPTTARGLFLKPVVIERLDLNQENGIHHRRRETLLNDQWVEEILVP